MSMYDSAQNSLGSLALKFIRVPKLMHYVKSVKIQMKIDMFLSREVVKDNFQCYFVSQIRITG